MIRPLQAFLLITATFALLSSRANASLITFNPADKIFVADNPQQVNEDDINFVTFYPNPVKDMLTIRFPRKGNSTVTIYNIIGDKVLSKRMVDDTELRLDISELQNGMYFLSYEFDGKILTKRFSKTN